MNFHLNSAANLCGNYDHTNVGKVATAHSRHISFPANILFLRIFLIPNTNLVRWHFFAEIPNVVMNLFRRADISVHIFLFFGTLFARTSKIRNQCSSICIRQKYCCIPRYLSTTEKLSGHIQTKYHYAKERFFASHRTGDGQIFMIFWATIA